jgi:hypothetical protein
MGGFYRAYGIRFSGGKDFTAPAAAPGQHTASVPGGHTRAEAMLFAALALLGLIRSKHLCYTPSFLTGHAHEAMQPEY